MEDDKQPDQAAPEGEPTAIKNAGEPLSTNGKRDIVVPDVVAQTVADALQTGDGSKANDEVAALRARIVEAPDDAKSLARLAFLLSKSIPDEARKIAEKAAAVGLPDYQSVNNIADTYVRLDEYDRAIATIEQYVAGAPDSDERTKLIGRAYCMKKQYGKALKVMEPVMARAGDDSSAQYYYAFALVREKRPEEAESICRAVLTRFPQNRRLRGLLASVCTFSGKADEAVDICKKLLDEGEKTERTYGRLAAAERERKHYKEAHEAIDRAIELSKNPADLYVQKGETFEREHRHEQALEMFRKAASLQTEPDDHTRAHEAIALVRSGRMEEAIPILKKLVNGEFKLSAYGNLAHIYQRRGRFEKALQNIDEAIKLNPLDGDYYVSRGVSLAGLGRYQDALRCYAKAATLGYADTPILAFNRAVALARLKRFESAYAEIEKIPEPLSDEYEVQFNRGVIALGMRRFDDAIAAFRQALEDRKRSGSALLGIAEASLAQGRLEDARDAALEALDAEQGADALMLLAAISFDLGRQYSDNTYYSDCLAYADEALNALRSEPSSDEGDDNEIALRSVRAAAFAEMGRLGSAKRELQRQIRLLQGRRRNEAIAKSNIRRLNRAVAEGVQIPGWLPYVVAASAFALCLFSIYLLGEDLLTGASFTSLVIALLVISALVFILPSLSRLKIAGVELEKADLGRDSVLHLEMSKLVDLVDLHNQSLEGSKSISTMGFHHRKAS